MPRVSVIMIVLDGERFLPEALDSVVAQTMPDWELVIVDDGSTDRTPEIAGALAAREPERVRVVTHPDRTNRGMSASRNLGVRESRGAYVTFLDHDDVMMPEKLREQAALLDDHPNAAAVFGPNLLWRSWDPGAGDEPDEIQTLDLPTDRVAPPPGPLPSYLASSAATPLGFMIRRTAFDDVGGYEETFRGMYEDQVFQAKLYLDHPVYVSSRVWIRYRRHPDSCVIRTFREGGQLLARRRFLHWLRDHVASRPVADAELRRLIREELRRTGRARATWLVRQARNRIARFLGRGS
ncbi:MAG: glycosyltransferase family 2 protein [Planctomycetes bacterium]|nr:glycosyltransferase family 2 protein [Planctomycetota bacterium]